MVIKLNTARLNGTRLNSASLNGVGERLRASAGGGGGVIIPPPEPEEPDTPVTYTLAATADNGKVSASVNGKSVTLPYVANAGDVVVMEVTADEGFMFEGWSDGSTDNPRSITMTADVTLSATCVVKAVEKEYIEFADPAVEAVLMAKGVSSDGVGITKEDAAAVTSIGTWFKGNTDITSFNEFEYFTGVTFLGISTNQISGGAFNGCTSLVSIKMPSSVAELRPGAFYNCTSLRSAGDLSKVKKIGIYAFAGTLLEGEINLASVEGEIGYKAFTKTNITKILSLGNATIIGGSTKSDTGAFGECGLLQYVDLPSTTAEIRSWAFYKCTALQTFICRATTPPTLANANAFSNTNNCPIYVPDAALEVYKTATNWSQYQDRIHPLSELEGSPYIQFADAEVERVLMENNVSSDGVGITMADAQAVTEIGYNWFRDNTAITSFDELQYFTGLKFLGNYYPADRGTFAGCTSLKSVIIPQEVTDIRNQAFRGCTSLESVNIDHLTNIGQYSFLQSGIKGEINCPYLQTLGYSAFARCPNITKVVDLGMVTDLKGAEWPADNNWGGFAQCTSLESVIINDCVTSIGYNMFYGCTALQWIKCYAVTPPSLGNANAFANTNNCPIYVPDASVDAYKAAANWSTYADRIKPLSEYVES